MKVEVSVHVYIFWNFVVIWLYLIYESLDENNLFAKYDVGKPYFILLWNKSNNNNNNL